MSEEVSTSVLVERIEGLKTLAKEQHQETVRNLDEIRKQTTKTNGRVTRLERWQTAIISGSVVVLFLLRDSLIDVLRHIF